MPIDKQLMILALVAASAGAACDDSPIHGKGPEDANVADLLYRDSANPAEATAGKDAAVATETCDADTRVGDGDSGGSCVGCPICGNGIVDWNEGCDDLNSLSGDGCSSACKVEPGFRCSLPGLRCTGICGDGIVKGSETCDDGNTLGGDGCSDICLADPGYFCGDGVISGDEECDDGPANSDTNYGGCSSRCRYNRCGDGILNGGEECDCGDNYTEYISTPPCLVGVTWWPPAYCSWCRVLPDLGG
jgi:large repetitive protein